MTNPPGGESRQHPDEHALVQAMHASDALRQLLAAAAAPPSKAELKGRSRAVAAFRAAYRLRRPGAGSQPAGAPEPPDQAQPAARAGADLQPRADGSTGNEDRAAAGGRRRTRLARARRWSAAQLTVVGAALLMLLGAATAAAAAAGQLPTPLQQTVSDLFDGPANHGPDSHDSGSVPSAVHSLSPVPNPSPATPSTAATRSPGVPVPSRSTDPAAQLAGLCRAYQSAAAAPGAALSAPGFLPLIRAAGGTAEVDSFCAALPATGRAASPAVQTWTPKAERAAAAGRQAAHSGRSAPPAGSRTGTPPPHPRPAPRLPAARQAGNGSGHLHR